MKFLRFIIRTHGKTLESAEEDTEWAIHQGHIEKKGKTLNWSWASLQRPHRTRALCLVSGISIFMWRLSEYFKEEPEHALGAVLRPLSTTYMKWVKTMRLWTWLCVSALNLHQPSYQCRIFLWTCVHELRNLTSLLLSWGQPAKAGVRRHSLYEQSHLLLNVHKRKDSARKETTSKWWGDTEYGPDTAKDTG